MPARLEDGFGKYDGRGAIVVQKDSGGAYFLDLRDVNGACGIIADGYELALDEAFAVNLVESSVCIGLGLFGTVRQDVGDDSFVATFR